MMGKEALPLGELRYDREGRRESAAFAYTSDWLAHVERFAIDPLSSHGERFPVPRPPQRRLPFSRLYC